MISKKLGILFIITSLIPWSTSALEGTYYADSFEGKGTADGSNFSQSVFSAAACDVDLGQYGYVRYGNTGAVVTINDRPNCRKHPDVIDLSRSAFGVFAPTSVGRITEVSLSLLGKNERSFPKRDLSEGTFSDLGIRLTKSISNTYFTEDSVLIQGKVTLKKEYALIYLEEKSTGKKVVTELAKTDKNGNFSYLLRFPKQAGEYYFIVAGGNSFETTNPPLIKLVKEDDLIYPEIPASRFLFRPVVTDTSKPYIVLPKNTWASLEISRDGKSFSTKGQGGLSFDGINFTPGKAQVTMSGYTISTPSSLDRSQFISQMYSGTVVLDRIHDSFGKQKISVRTTKQIANFRFRLKKHEKVRSLYYVTLPNGDVREYEIPRSFVDGTTNLVKTEIWVYANFPIKDQGTYKLELVQSDGFAYVNTPIYQGAVWGILPTISESEKVAIQNQASIVERDVLFAINQIRASLGRNLLSLDTTLTSLAQAKAENMAKDEYVGHYTKSDQDVLAFGRSIGIRIVGSVGENVGGGNVSHIALQDGLEESGSHRYNMIDPSWKRMGIGYVIKDGKTYLVQIFGE